MSTTSPADTAVQNLHGIPEIITLEEKEETRVQAKLAAFAEEESAFGRTSKEEIQETDAAARAKAKEELEAYKKEELTRILAKSEEQREEQVKAVNSSYKKKAPTVLSQVVNTLTDGSLLS